MYIYIHICMCVYMAKASHVVKLQLKRQAKDRVVHSAHHNAAVRVWRHNCICRVMNCWLVH